MKRPAVFGAFFALALASGCVEPSAAGLDGADHPTASFGALEVSVAVSRASLAIGEKITVTVAAKNTSMSPLSIEADTNVPVIVKIWRHTALGWDVVRKYPTAAIPVKTTLALAPGERKSFPVELKADLDWPTSERLRITGEVNGCSKARASSSVFLFGPEAKKQ